MSQSTNSKKHSNLYRYPVCGSCGEDSLELRTTKEFSIHDEEWMTVDHRFHCYTCGDVEFKMVEGELS